MNKLLLAVALFVLSVTGAVAADLPYTKAPPPPIVSVFNWTGFYVGLNGGYSWGHQSIDPAVLSDACDNPLGCPQILALLSGAQRIDPNGFTGGLQFGFNQQFGQHALFGLEADVDYFRLAGSFAYGPLQPSQQPITGAGTGSVTTNWVATIRPRLGYVADRLLVYVTGGLAFTDQRNTETAIVVVNGQIAGPIGNFALSSTGSFGRWA